MMVTPHRVTTNTTLFDGADPKSVRLFFDEMMEVGVEGMMLSPGYSYDKAPDQKHFLRRARTRRSSAPFWPTARRAGNSTNRRFSSNS
jgi:hypothetical protein